MLRKPLFHIDIHGKKDRKYNMDIDIGTKAIREDFHQRDQDTLVKSLIRQITSRINDVFSNKEIKGFRVKGNPEGELVGKWEGIMHTMTHQSVLLGVPAI